MDTVNVVGLAEFDALRREIELRLTQSNQLIALALAAFGTGLSISAQVPQVLVGAAAVSSLLWGLIVDNSNRMQQIGMYIALGLRHSLTERAGQSVLRWELFYRGVADMEPVDAVRTVTKVARHSYYQAVLFAFALQCYCHSLASD